MNKDLRAPVPELPMRKYVWIPIPKLFSVFSFPG